MMRSGGISISMIVIASIGVIVLSIVAALVIQAGGDVQQAQSCSNIGTCEDTGERCGDGRISGAQMDCGSNSRCCIRTNEQQSSSS